MKLSPHRISREFSWPVKLCRFSRHRAACWTLLGLAMILARVALLPVLPVPDPIVHDEFSYLLSADTFAHGRLTNPELPMPEFFESPHVLVSPMYASKYPPGQGLILAVGQKLFGDPYWGVVLSGAAMIFLLCWAADAWLPPQWTLIAGGLSAVFFFVRHYWFSSYWGGALAASGGALLVGGLGRLLSEKPPGARFSLSVGALILYATRPYEGGVLCLVVLGILGFLNSSSSPGKRRIWMRSVILPNAAVLLAGALLIGWYNLRTTGSTTDTPYLEYARLYDRVSPFWVLPPKPDKEYSNANTRAAHDVEQRDYREVRRLGVAGAIGWQLLNFFPRAIWLQFSAFGLLLAGVPWARLRKGKKWLVLMLGSGIAALLPEVWIHPHYAAPFTAVELILIVAAARAMWYRLAAYRWRGPVFVAVLLLLFIPLGAEYALIQARTTDRGRLVRKLASMGGRHLIFVSYAEHWDSGREWVYNGADLDGSAVLFAHLRSDGENQQLIDRYPGRTAWIVRLGPAQTDVHLESYGAALARAKP